MDMLAMTISVGLGVGSGSTKAPYPEFGVYGTRDTSNPVAVGFASARTRYIGLEGGFLMLPKYTADASVPDYPAYRLVNFGEVVTTPAGVVGTQKITSRAGYLRLNLYGPELWKITPYGFLGRAWVRTHNVEHADYTGPTESADFQITLNQATRYMGAGLEMSLTPGWSIRAEGGYLPSAVRSYWTNHRDVKIGTLSARLSW
jgi:hypothetical protein